MNAKERGFLLLTSHLGDPNRKVLTPAQRRILTQRVNSMDRPKSDRDLEISDLVALGYGREMARNIVTLLSQEDWLDEYIRLGKRNGCTPVTRVSTAYPPLVMQRLGLEAPGCYWAKGDLSLLNSPAISLVGSRELREDNQAFARAVGLEAARQGFTLVSGNARGADQAAQEACLSAGGQVISVLPDELTAHEPRQNQLLLSLDDFNAPFTKQRALARNLTIQTMGLMVFVAQSDLHRGGTWDGTAKNLEHCWSTVVCFRDGSESSRELKEMGAFLLGAGDLDCIADLKQML